MKRSLVVVARTLPVHGHGGMETHAWQLAQAWARRGWEVEVLTTSFEDRTFVQDVDGVRVHSLRHLPLNRSEVPTWRWWHRFAARVRDYAIAHRIDADVVHSESVYGHALFRALRRRGATMARVMTIHGTGLQTYRDATRRQLLARVGAWHPRAIGQWLYVKQRAWREARVEYPSAQRLVAVSERLADHLAHDYGLPRDAIDVIGNGVEPPFPRDGRDALRTSLGLPRDARIVLYLGRLDATKRVDLLIEHAARAPRDRILIAGWGPDEARLRRLAETLPNPGAVRFLGTVSHDLRRQLYVAADVFALASEAEGQPITILEALAAGTPVYARHPWVPRDLAPLLATGDDVSAGIDAAHANAARVAAASAGIVQAHGWDDIAQRYEDVFRRARP